MIMLDLAIWTLGAELLHPRGLTIKYMDDLPRLLTTVLGDSARTLFYLGIFAAVFTSLLGQAVGLAYLGSHAHQRWLTGTAVPHRDYSRSPYYQLIIVWCLVSPLVWTLPGMPDFVTLTLFVNSGQVALLPMFVGGLWWITASQRYIGTEYQNRWWENLMMALLSVLFVIAAVQLLVDRLGS